MKQDCIDGKFIKLPKIGKVKVILHRALPDGFKIKTATITRKADGWYVTLSLEDSSVPELSPELPTLKNTIGIDMGLKSFLVMDDGKDEPIPQYYRKAQEKLGRLQRSLSRKKKGSRRRKKAVRRVAKAHQKVANQRQDFHYKTAKKLLNKGKHIGHEALNIKGIARTRMAKSTNDAGWGQFLQILSVKAANAGLIRKRPMGYQGSLRSPRSMRMPERREYVTIGTVGSSAVRSVLNARLSSMAAAENGSKLS